MRLLPLLTLFFAVACGGGSSPAALSATFARVVEGSNSTAAILPLSDGSTIIAGRAPSDLARFVAPDDSTMPVEMVGEQFLMCYDRSGELLWHSTFGQYHRWVDLAEAPDGTVVALGATQRELDLGPDTIYGGPWTTTYFIARMNRSGTVLSADEIVHSSESEGRGRLAVGSDGSLSVFLRNGAYCQILPDTENYLSAGQSLLLHYDAALALQWSRFFPGRSSMNVAVLANGDTVCTMADGPAASIFRFDSVGGAGEVPEVSGSFQPWDLAACGDGYAISAVHNDDMVFDSRTFAGEGSVLLRVGSSATLEWFVAFDSGTSFSGIACGTGGELLAAGGVESETTRRDGLVLLYNSAGNLIRRERFDSAAWLNVSEAWFLPGGGIGLSGQASGPSSVAVPGGNFPLDADDVLFSLQLR